MDLSTQQTHAHQVWNPTDNQNLGNICPNTKVFRGGPEGQLRLSTKLQAPPSFHQECLLLDLMVPEEKLLKNMEISSNT